MAFSSKSPLHIRKYPHPYQYLNYLDIYQWQYMQTRPHPGVLKRTGGHKSLNPALKSKSSTFNYCLLHLARTRCSNTNLV